MGNTLSRLQMADPVYKIASPHIVYDSAWNRTLLRVSPSCLLTGLVAASLGQWDTAVGEVAVFSTSVLHWRNPVHGSRARMLDMVVVSVSLTVHLHAMWAVGTAAASAFVVMVVAMACFGWSLHRGSYTHHAAGWFISCLSNLLLASARYSCEAAGDTLSYRVIAST